MRIDATKLAEIVKLNQTLELNTGTKTNGNIDTTKKVDGAFSFQLKAESSLTTIGKSYFSDLGNLSDIREMAENQDVRVIKNQMAVLSNTMTPEDYQKVQEEGYDFTDTEITTMVTVVDKIQVKLASYCEDYEGVVDSLSKEEIESIGGNSEQVYKIAKKLKEHSLPITEENIEETINALERAKNLTPLTNGITMYLISNELSPTIENIYKAEHSGSIDSMGGHEDAYTKADVKGYYSKVSSQAYNQKSLDDQIHKIIKDAGIAVTEETVADAKLLVENQIPLTKESLVLLKDLKELTLPISEDEAIEYMAKAIKDGKKPIQAGLFGNEDFYNRAKEVIDVVSNVTDKSIQFLINSHKEITIENLSKTQSGEISLGENNYLNTLPHETITKRELELITAKRQLEEIRLQMTIGANVKLLKQGFHIETESLENIVKELKQIENNYYRTLLEDGNVSATDENIDILKETGKKIQSIKDLPNFILGNISRSRSLVTVNSIYQEGTVLKDTLDKANQTYEALMTKPRTDMGDSIKTAFRNIDAILEDLGMDITEVNEKTVRILAYNQMEINEESIQNVKQADATVNSLIKNLTPATTLELIRRDINPLNVDIRELNLQLQEINDEIPLQKEEKYSEFLWKLEKNNEISTTEKEAYIGIYRLLHQIEKTDGGVIGSLVNQEVELTLKNLLTGIRSNKSKGMDISLDESFGGLEELTFTGSSISEQIEAGFQKIRQRESSGFLNEKGISYNEMLARQILSEITPSKLQQLEQTKDIYTMPLDEMAYELSQMESMVGKEDIDYQQGQLKELQKLQNIEANVIRMLTDTGQPITIGNLISANSMISERGALYNKLVKEVNNISENRSFEGKELPASLEEIIKRAGDSLTDIESMGETYKKLEKVSSKVLTASLEDSGITFLKLKEIQALHKEIKLYGDLGRKERYEVPLVIGDEITSVRLTFIKNTGEKGRVKATLESSILGKVAAEFSVKDGKISGYIITDTKKTLDTLKESKEFLENEIETGESIVEKIEYIQGKDMNLDQFDLLKEKEKTVTSVSTKDLYKVAKSFITTINHINREEEL